MENWGSYVPVSNEWGSNKQRIMNGQVRIVMHVTMYIILNNCRILSSISVLKVNDLFDSLFLDRETGKLVTW